MEERGDGESAASEIKRVSQEGAFVPASLQQTQAQTQASWQHTQQCELDLDADPPGVLNVGLLWFSYWVPQSSRCVVFGIPIRFG